MARLYPQRPSSLIAAQNTIVEVKQPFFLLPDEGHRMRPIVIDGSNFLGTYRRHARESTSPQASPTPSDHHQHYRAFSKSEPDKPRTALADAVEFLLETGVSTVKIVLPIFEVFDRYNRVHSDLQRLYVRNHIVCLPPAGIQQFNCNDGAASPRVNRWQKEENEAEDVTSPPTSESDAVRKKVAEIYNTSFTDLQTACISDAVFENIVKLFSNPHVRLQTANGKKRLPLDDLVAVYEAKHIVKMQQEVMRQFGGSMNSAVRFSSTPQRDCNEFMEFERNSQLVDDYHQMTLSKVYWLFGGCIISQDLFRDLQLFDSSTRRFLQQYRISIKWTPEDYLALRFNGEYTKLMDVPLYASLTDVSVDTPSSENEDVE